MTREHWNSKLRIENPRNHSYEAVEKLRRLLAEGAGICEDPHRADFYEVHDDAAVYYIYASPITGKVYLLASSQKEALPVTA